MQCPLGCTIQSRLKAVQPQSTLDNKIVMTHKKAILLMNLGSPASTAVPDVRRYLNEVLMDERVIDVPYLLRLLLVRGIIVTFRAPKSAKAYQSIWTSEGSPLMVHTQHLQTALQALVEEPVEICMRYGNPTPQMAYDALLAKHPALEEVVLVPLYPHYAMSSYETAVEYAKGIHLLKAYPFNLTVVQPYYNKTAYIQALAESIRPYLMQPYDHILFSYHGIPGRHVRKSDITEQHCLKVSDCCNVPSLAHNSCYRHQVLVTTKLLVESLQIPAEKYSVSFQSRLVKGWLQPFTDKRLEEMPAEGIKHLLIACPAFVSDCLETLEEIAEEGKEIFMHAGGESFTMIPCMNEHPQWVSALAGMCSAPLGN